MESSFLCELWCLNIIYALQAQVLLEGKLWPPSYAMNVRRHFDRLAFKCFGGTTSVCPQVAVSAELRMHMLPIWIVLYIDDMPLTEEKLR
jgi:hypothetical protein